MLLCNIDVHWQIIHSFLFSHCRSYTQETSFPWMNRSNWCHKLILPRVRSPLMASCDITCHPERQVIPIHFQHYKDGKKFTILWNFCFIYTRRNLNWIEIMLFSTQYCDWYSHILLYTLPMSSVNIINKNLCEVVHKHLFYQKDSGNEKKEKCKWPISDLMIEIWNKYHVKFFFLL